MRRNLDDWPIFVDGDFRSTAYCREFGHTYSRLPESSKRICLICGYVSGGLLNPKRHDPYLESYKRTHTWPRGLKAKLIRMDGDHCFICHSTMRPLVIHHFKEDGGWSDDKYPYSDENKYDPKFLILVCRSCHGKMHTVAEHWTSPFSKAVQIAFKERKQKVLGEFG